MEDYRPGPEEINEDTDVKDLIEGLSDSLQAGDYREAIRYWEFLSKDQDVLNRITGFKNMVMKCFLECLEKGEVHEAYELMDEFGKGIDFSEEIEKGYLKNLLMREAEFAREINKLFATSQKMRDRLFKQHKKHAVQMLRDVYGYTLSTAVGCGFDTAEDIGQITKAIRDEAEELENVKGRDESDES